ncbi:MAG TPA: leucyl aminopeptidase [Dissulfurispiraceae bacterium]|nr:leucyl aminopeptidase [Dissulfurispiraceae bacterium]
MTMLKIISSNDGFVQIKADLLIFPLCEDMALTQYPDCEADIRKRIAAIVKSGDFAGRHGQTFLIPIHAGRTARILLVGLGKKAEVTAERLRQSGAKAFLAVRQFRIKTIAVAAHLFNGLDRERIGFESASYYLVEGGLLARYRFGKYRQEDQEDKEITLQAITILGEEAPTDARRLIISVQANAFARDLVLTPANELTPAALAVVARGAVGNNVRVSILDKKAIAREGMRAFLAVAQGSQHEPKLIVMEYNGANGAPTALVGKAVTFDSGGISLKPSDGMEKMKYDMAGAAAVIGVMQALSRLKVKQRVVAVIPACENLPGGGAFRPGDVIKSRSGKTVEIISTDAEGRLILADALDYAIKHFKPREVIDIATLTGACSIAFGHVAIALMSTSPELVERLKLAGTATYERVWEMPLFEEFREYIKGEVSDIKNAGGRKGSLISAGSFLREFVGTAPWAHLDIAGTAWIDKDKPYFSKGATGVGVRLLLEFLRDTGTKGKK